MTFHSELTTTDDVVENWPYDFQNISTSGGVSGYGVDYGLNYGAPQPGEDTLYGYLSTFATVLERIDGDVSDLYHSIFIETATDEELEQLGAEVGITRRSGEDDDTLRFRIELRKLAAASNGTAPDIAHILESTFSEDVVESANIAHSPGHPVVQIGLPQTALDDIPLDRPEFQDELERAFPAGHGIELVTTDTWLLNESGSQGIGEGGLI